MPQIKHVLLPCYSLEHNRNEKFFGQRRILEQMDKVLISSSSTSDSNITPSTEVQCESPEAATLKTFAICGMGGLGKSEIAIEYMHSRKNEFDAIFWVNSASIQKLDAGFRDVAAKLGLQDEESLLNDDPEATRDIVKSWLANPMRTFGADSPQTQAPVNWLMVFDNADEPEMLENFWPLGGTGSIIITSRDPLAKNGIFAQRTNKSKFIGIDISPMLIEDAAKLLQNVSMREDEHGSLESCIKVANLLDCLPLAITQMAYQIQAMHLSLEEFIEYYEEDTANFHEAALVSGLTKQQTIAATWSIEKLDPTSLALLQVLSVLDADVIQEDILLTGATKIQLDNYPKTRIEYFNARKTLMKSSLVSRNVELRFLRIHRIVQDVVRQKLSTELLRNVYNGAVTLVSTVWPYTDGSGSMATDRLRTIQQLLPHIAAFRFVAEKKTPSVLKPDVTVTRLFNEVSW